MIVIREENFVRNKRRGQFTLENLGGWTFASKLNFFWYLASQKSSPQFCRPMSIPVLTQPLLNFAVTTAVLSLVYTGCGRID